VESSLDGRVIGVDSGSLLSVDRRIAVAGGRQKWPAIRASLRGGWVTVLVTDVETATYLMTSCAPTD
jgi:DNA-binding transcriptional regulator LsrR (DeoR family)